MGRGFGLRKKKELWENKRDAVLSFLICKMQTFTRNNETEL
jgi:hypothetical protein